MTEDMFHGNQPRAMPGSSVATKLTRIQGTDD